MLTHPFLTVDGTVVLPTNSPDLGPVEFRHTAHYYWPQFDQNVTGADGEPLSNNPNPTGHKRVQNDLFLKTGIELDNEKEEVKYCKCTGCILEE